MTRAENSRAVRDTVEQHIKELISAGQLSEDGRLPTERELAEQLAVSRTTVRQVLDRLEHEGFVYRRRGRTGGTFVNRPRVDIDFGYLAGIPAYLRAQGFRPGAHVVSARMVPADDTTAAALRIPAGTLVYEVVRIRLADEVRISLETARIPVSLAPNLLAQPLDDSIYDLLTDRYGVTCVKAVERMVAVLADEEQSGLLGIKVGTPDGHRAHRLRRRRSSRRVLERPVPRGPDEGHRLGARRGQGGASSAQARIRSPDGS